MSVHGNAPATPPGQAKQATVLPDPGKGLARAASEAARLNAWKGQAQDPTHKQDRIDTWTAQNGG